MRREKTNPELIALVQDLKRVGREQNAPVWRDIAKRLEKPLSRWAEVNVGHLNRVCQDGDVIAVPGKVLAAGDLEKKLTVAAWKFSASAEKKIKAAGGKAISLRDLMKENPRGAGVRIIS